MVVCFVFGGVGWRGCGGMGGIVVVVVAVCLFVCSFVSGVQKKLQPSSVNIGKGSTILDFCVMSSKGYLLSV